MLAISQEPMWIDRSDADTRIAAIATTENRKELADRLTDFKRDGFVILRQAVPHQAIDNYIAEFDEAAKTDQDIMVSYGRDVFPIAGQDLHKPLLKILDTLVKLPTAMPLAFADRIVEFVEEVFDDAPLAFQSLHFEVGSTQAIHQDTAYVVLNQPRKLVAAWIALQDVEPGSGELIYYPGSHRFGEFMYPGDKKHWNPETDGDAIHDHHLNWLHVAAKENGVSTSSFLPKKGDVLIWHADLAHGGGEITDPSLTRRSLVVHYGPASSNPHYFQSVEEQRRRKVPVEKGYVSSMYYDIEAWVEGAR